MIKNKLFQIAILACLTFTYGCDKIEPPYIVNQNIDTNSQTVKQNVFVEYFTGHKCPNCPTAAHQLKDLKELYKDRLVFISIHAGSFALPIGQNYSADYRTSVGTELDDFFQVTSISTPNGLVNRKNFDEGTVLPPNSWSSIIASELLIEPVLNISFPTIEKTASSVIVNAKIEVLEAIEGAHSLTVYIVEDSIQSYQKNSNSEVGFVPDIPDYYHRYVLRSSMNGTWGDTLFSSAIQEQVLEKQYTISISSEWNSNRLYVVAFVANFETDEVLQVQMKKIQ